MELIVGDIAFSTWSLRPWLVLKRCGAEFALTDIPLYGDGWKERLAEVSPSGKVPLLKVDGETIWDSLSICVWAAERSVVCEMHSGFAALRSECAMGPDASGVIHTMVGPDRAPPPRSEAVAADLRRFVEIVRSMRARFGQDDVYLFGAWSIADAFFTPVACRIRHYQIDLSEHGDRDGVAVAYVAELLQQPDFLAWSEQAVAKAR